MIFGFKKYVKNLNKNIYMYKKELETCNLKFLFVKAVDIFVA